MVKYIHVTVDGSHFPELITEKVSRPGMYQWSRAFNTGKDTGEIRHINQVAQGDLKNYDIVHANLCGVSAASVTRIKDAIRGTNTKLILNLDYAVEIVQEGFPRPKEMWEALMAADFIFAQEPFQKNFIEFFLKYHCPEKRDMHPIPIIPHPCDTEGLKQFCVPNEDRLDQCAVIIHRYREHIMVPAMVTWGIKSNTWGVGFTQGNMPLGMFTESSPLMEWDRYVYKLAHSTTALDYYLGIHSHSRFVEECACLKIPCVSTAESYMGKLLFPELNHDEMDMQGIRSDLEKLEKGFEAGEQSEFYLEQQQKASEAVEQFNWLNSKQHLLDAMRTWGIEFK